MAQSPKQMKVSNAVYENCHLALDSPQDNEVVNAMLLHVTPGITFQHCLITYSGGTINLILSCKDRAANIDVGNPVTAHSQVIINTPSTLSFENCLFRWNLAGSPPDEGRELTETLLASKGAKIEFGVKKPS